MRTFISTNDFKVGDSVITHDYHEGFREIGEVVERPTKPYSPMFVTDDDVVYVKWPSMERALPYRFYQLQRVYTWWKV